MIEHKPFFIMSFLFLWPWKVAKLGAQKKLANCMHNQTNTILITSSKESYKINKDEDSPFSTRKTLVFLTKIKEKNAPRCYENRTFHQLSSLTNNLAKLKMADNFKYCVNRFVAKFKVSRSAKKLDNPDKVKSSGIFPATCYKRQILQFYKL